MEKTLEERMESLEKRIVELEKEAQEHQTLKITSNKNVNIKIGNYILTYLNYVQESVEKAQKGAHIDKDELYALGDSIRVIHHIRKLLEHPGPLKKL